MEETPTRTGAEGRDAPVHAAERPVQAAPHPRRPTTVQARRRRLSASWAFCALCLLACAVTVALVLATGPPPPTGPPEPMLTPAPARPH